MEVAQIQSAVVTDEIIAVTLFDGRIIHTPLWWFPVIARASSTERQHWELFPHSILWETLHEMIPVEAFVQGIPDVRSEARAWRRRHGYSSLDSYITHRKNELQAVQCGTSEAAHILGVTRQRVHALIKSGRLPATKLGTDYIITLHDLEAIKTRTHGRPRKQEQDAVTHAPTA